MTKGKANEKLIIYAGRDEDERLEREAKGKEAAINTEIAIEKAKMLDKMLEDEEMALQAIADAVKFEEEHGPQGIKPPNGAVSMIAPEEEESVKADIEKFLEFPPPNPPGFLMAVMVYTRKDGDTFSTKDGKKTSILVTEAQRERDRYEQVVGLVVAQGPRCYLPSRNAYQFEENWFRKLIRPFFGSWMKPDRHPPDCKVGDWICFSRIEGEHMNYRGKPMVFLPDDKLLCVVPHPSYVTRG